MSIKGDIREGLATIVGSQLSSSMVCVFIAEVQAVDANTRTCTVVSTSLPTETEFSNVALMAESTDGFLCLPAVGSAVMVCDPKTLNPFVLMYSEVDKVQIVVNKTAQTITDGKIAQEIGSTTFTTTSGLSQFNDGGFGGLVKVAELTTKLNNLENDLNVLKTALAAIITTLNAAGPVPLLSGGPSGLGAVLSGALATYIADVLIPTLRLQLENTKVKHG